MLARPAVPDDAPCAAELIAATIDEMPGGEFYIAHLATDAKFRRQGVAKFLLETAERLARAAGQDKLSLIVEPENDPAVSLYLANGFAIAGRIQTPMAGLPPALRMSLPHD
jgi:ribosomal protein S18 acetylase RimI-like enzyme